MTDPGSDYQNQYDEYQKRAWAALDAYFRDTKYFVTEHHLRSYDDFVDRGMAETIRSMNPLTLVQEDAETKKRHSVSLFIGSERLFVDRPTVVDAGGVARPLFPNEARLKDMTYAVNVYADVRIEYSVDGQPLGEPVALEKPVLIGTVPIMLHSSKCLLRGMPPDVLREMGECPNDQGGYFVVDGREKVIIAQEEHVSNRLYIREGDASNDDVSHIGWIRCFSMDQTDVFPRTTTFRVRSRTARRPNAIRVTVTHVDPPIPLFVLFRALGVESDRAIMEHVVYDVAAPEEQDVVEFLRACALDAADRGVVDQRSAIAALAPLTKYGTEANLRAVLTYDLFPNVPPDFSVKALQLGYMTRRIVRVVLGKDDVPVRDDYANVRMQLSGFKLSDLFRDVYLRLYEYTTRALATEYYSGAWRQRGDFRSLVTAANIKHLVPPYIVTENIQKAFKGAWGVDDEASADDIEEGVVQDLNRVSFLSYVSHVRRVNNPIDRSVKLADPHKMLASHWGCVCPVESPDGPNIGLIKHLAVLAHVTLASDARPLVDNLVESALVLPLRSFRDLGKLRGLCKVFVNDTWSAVTMDPPRLVEHVRTLRRGGAVDRDVSIAWNIVKGEVHVHTDRGRCCRPLVRVDAGSRRPLLLAQDAAAASWDTLFSAADRSNGGKLPRATDAKAIAALAAAAGPLELVDVEELMTLLVAMGPDYIERHPLNRYTHCELHPATILSLVTATYPMLNHNNAAYNVLCLAQFKQAIGTFCTNFNARMDTMGCVLHHPQRPLVSTRIADKLCHGRLAHGENLIVAVASYTGYNQEDSILLNLDSVERGRFNMTYFKTHRFQERTPRFGGSAPLRRGGGGGGGEAAVAFGNPARLAAEGKDVRRVSESDRYANIGPDGMPVRNARVHEGEVLLGQVAVEAVDVDGGDGSDARATVYTDRSVAAGRSHDGFVDRVFLYRSSEGGRCAKVRMRQVRAPELGDKMGSRFGQKGVVGMLLRAQDMPFCHSSGLVPDLILNPNAFPKRMTVTHLLECLLAKAGSATGRRFNVDTFDRVDVVGEAAAALRAHGLHEHGDEVLYNGKTGEQVATKVFVGVNYYGRLKHMVKDKYQYRVRGKRAAVTRQPAKALDGASGGLRLGEMERDVLLAHGMSSFLKESFMDRSDRYRAVVDAEQGVLAQSADQRDGRYAAAPKGDDRDTRPPRFVSVEVPYAFKLLQQELQSMCIDARLEDSGCESGPSDADSPDDDDDDAGSLGEDVDDVRASAAADDGSKPWLRRRAALKADDEVEDETPDDGLDGTADVDDGDGNYFSE
jgi:DNA-directed RNA polymerase II subunit RPB2